MASKFHVFDVITPFHMICGMAYFLKYSNEGDELTVHLDKGMNGRYLVPDMCFFISEGRKVQLLHQESKIKLKRSVSFLLRRFLHRGEVSRDELHVGHHTYYKPTVAGYISDSYSGKKLVSFCFEEGVGSYNSLLQEREIAIRENKRFYVVKYFLKKLLATRFFVDRTWVLLKQKDRENAQYYFRRAAKVLGCHVYGYSDDRYYSSASEERIRPRAVFFTSPFVRLGVLDECQNIDLMREIRKFYLENDIDMYVKPHPLDEEDYSILVDSDKVIKDAAPAEIHLMSVRYDCVGGINSGALITSRVMYGIKAFNFFDYLPDDAKVKLKLGSVLRGLFDTHVVECKKKR